METNLTKETFEKLTLGEVGFWAYIISVKNAGAKITLDMITSTTKLSQHKVVQYLTGLSQEGLLKYEAKVIPSRKSKTVEYIITDLVENDVLAGMDNRFVQIFMSLVGAEGVALYGFMKHRAGEGNIYYSEGFRKDAELLNMSATTLQKIIKQLVEYEVIEKQFFQSDAGKKQSCYVLIGYHTIKKSLATRLPPLARDLYLRAEGEVVSNDISVDNYKKSIYTPTLRNFYFEYRHPSDSEVLIELPSYIEENTISIMVDDRFQTMSVMHFDGIKVIGRKEDLQQLAVLEEANMVSADMGIVSIFFKISHAINAKQSLEDISNYPFIILREGEETSTIGQLMTTENWYKSLLRIAKNLKSDTTNLSVNLNL